MDDSSSKDNSEYEFQNNEDDSFEEKEIEKEWRLIKKMRNYFGIKNY